MMAVTATASGSLAACLDEPSPDYCPVKEVESVELGLKVQQDDPSVWPPNLTIHETVEDIERV
jgi:hypothetical protein